MPTKKLNPRNVHTVPAPAKGAEIYWDSEPSAPSGFGIRVTAGGARSYVVAFRVKGKERRAALGAVEETSLKAARDEARDYREAARKGVDPVEQKRRDGVTLASLIDDYLAADETRALRTFREYRRLLTKEVVPAIGSIKPDEVTKPDVRAMLDAIASDKRARIKRGRRTLTKSPVTAHRVLGVLQACYSWAVDADRLERAPTWPKPPALKKHTKNGRTLHESGGRKRSLGREEIRQVWNAAAAEEAGGNVVGSALKMLLLLGQRRTETLSMRFADVAHESSGWWWTIPEERTKNGRFHRVPLSGLAVEIIDQRRGRGEDVWVFPSDRPPTSRENKDDLTKNYIASPSHALERLRAACPSLGHFTLHDMRRSVGSQMGEARVSQQDIAHVLNHTSHTEGPRVTKTYNRYAYDREKRLALETWERVLRGIIAGEDAAAADNVTPITAARG